MGLVARNAVLFCTSELNPHKNLLKGSEMFSTSKKVSVFTVVAVLALCLAGCGRSTLTPSDIAAYWIIQNPGGNSDISFEEMVESGGVGAFAFNEEGLFTMLVNTRNTGSIVRVGSYEIEGDKVTVNLPEYKDSRATADAIENAEITVDGDILKAKGISTDGSTVIAKRATKEEYQFYVNQAASHW